MSYRDDMQAVLDENHALKAENRRLREERTPPKPRERLLTRLWRRVQFKWRPSLPSTELLVGVPLVIAILGGTVFLTVDCHAALKRSIAHDRQWTAESPLRAAKWAETMGWKARRIVCAQTACDVVLEPAPGAPGFVSLDCARANCVLARDAKESR